MRRVQGRPGDIGALHQLRSWRCIGPGKTSPSALQVLFALDIKLRFPDFRKKINKCYSVRSVIARLYPRHLSVCICSSSSVMSGFNLRKLEFAISSSKYPCKGCNDLVSYIATTHELRATSEVTPDLLSDTRMSQVTERSREWRLISWLTQRCHKSCSDLRSDAWSPEWTRDDTSHAATSEVTLDLLSERAMSQMTERPRVAYFNLMWNSTQLCLMRNLNFVLCILFFPVFPQRWLKIPSWLFPDQKSTFPWP